MATCPPADWPQLSSALFYVDAHAAIAWLCRAYGFRLKLKVEDDAGEIAHSELVYGQALIMVSPQSKAPHHRSPRATGGMNTQTLMLHVPDVDAHCATARAAGATIVKEPTTSDYGAEYWSDRSYGAVDLEGHHWWFAQRLRDPPSAAT
jgi:uncharacterized glyoxalase superfamily protein PhnB